MNDEHTILNHYSLTNPFPRSWPTEKDDSEDSGEEKSSSSLKAGQRRSKSRYSALERRGSDGRRSLVPGSQKLRDGQENLVQRDEPDPLGASDSVVRVLRQKGLPVEEDSRLRNRFLLSSTTFSPNLYLSQVHSSASTQSLLQGLEVLSRSIDQKSASLKVLVESNFERFVRAKTTIDNVYAEMRNQGAEPEPDRSPRTHTRVSSRGSTHFRNPSGQGPPTPGKGVHKPLPNDKKRNALTKESEYGVQGIKAPLIEVAVKAEEIWGPALGGREREGSLKGVLESIENCEGIFNVGKTISECVKRKDYEALVEEYSRARKYVEEAKQIADSAIRTRTRLTDQQVHQIVITGRMWSEVEDRIANFKREVWRKLTSVQPTSAAPLGRSAPDEHIALISVLLELGTEENPIWFWLLSRYDHLKNKITATFERSRVEIEVLRRQLANAEPPAPAVVAAHLKNPTRKDSTDKMNHLDTPPVLELWDLIYNSLSNMLSSQGGVLGEVLEFWARAQNFIDGKAQKTLPIGIDGVSRKHHRLSADGISALQKGTVELVGLLQADVFAFFAEPPIEDISTLYSPVPNTPNSATPQSTTLAPFAHQDSRFKFDENHPPPASLRRGESWEEFAFWPPYANSLSGVHYLEKTLTLLGSAASEMMTMRPVASKDTQSDKLKNMVNAARERCARASCAAWVNDSELFKHMEDWSRSSDRQELTNMPRRFEAFESTVFAGMQKLMYIPEAATKSGPIGPVSPPPAKLVHMIRTQFLTSIYKILSGKVENAESSMSRSQDTKAVLDDLTVVRNAEGTSDGNSKDIRKLLTLSNLAELQNTIMPGLISQFEINFSIALTEDSKTIRDALTQISDRLFSSYTQPTASKLSQIVQAGICSPDWSPKTPRPSTVRPYVYEALLLLVYVHTEVSTTAAPLTHQILAYLFEQTLAAFLAAFKQRSLYMLPGLMQATLDVEFVAQTMSMYTSPKAGETQSEIYVQLDHRTSPEASKKLQGELPAMKQILKRLRDGTRSEFLCFKKSKRPQAEEPDQRG